MRLLTVAFLCFGFSHATTNTTESPTLQSTIVSNSVLSTPVVTSPSKQSKHNEDKMLHDELNILLKELRQVAAAIDNVRKEHNRLSKGVSEISRAVKEMNERSQHIQKKVHKLSKTLNKSNHHHKFKDGLKALQRDHEHIIRAVTSLTLHHRSLHLSNHHGNKSHIRKPKLENTTSLHTSNNTTEDSSFVPETVNVIDDGTSIPPIDSSNNIPELVVEPPEKKEMLKKADPFPRDCAEVMQKGNYSSGVYKITPKGMKKTIKVWCDHTTQGGGWTIFVARLPQEQQQDFKLTWEDYKNGFGEPDTEHWIGNEALHMMTTGRRHELRVNITNWKDEPAWAAWKDFNVANEENGFALTVGRYASSSTAGDALKWHNQMKFSTPDKDNDALMGGHCARKNDGGWWYKGYRGCYQAHPTGRFQKNPTQPPKATTNKRNFDLGPVLAWQNWRGETYFPKTLYLMFRPAP